MSRLAKRSWAIAGACGVALVGLLAFGSQMTAQQRPVGDWPNITGGDTGDPLLGARSDQRVELQHPEGRVGMARRKDAGRRARRRGQRARPADLRRRHAHHRLGPAPHGRVARSGDRQDAVDVPGADDAAPRVLDALEPRQGRRLHAHQRPRRRARHHARRSSCTRSTRKTGQPLENWGGAVPVAGFPKTGSVDLLKDLIADWEPWIEAEAARTTRPRACRSSSATSPRSSPPIVVNDVLVVGNSAEQGYNQTRIENVPGDILAYDARDRQVPVEVPRHSAAGRVRPRDVGERRVAVDRRRVVVGADVGRSGARPRLHPDQRRDDRLLRRLPARRQPVRHQPHRARREDRQARLALPDGASTTSGTTTRRPRRSCST